MVTKVSPALLDVLSLSAGAVLGANLRYWFGGWLSERLGNAFPYATLIVNLTGCLALGFVTTVLTGRYVVSPRLRIALTAGFLGAYTTFSTYEYESVNLMLTGHWGLGLLDLEESAILGAVAVGIGVLLGRMV